MKKIMCIIVLCICLLSNVSYGYQGKNFSITVPEEFNERVSKSFSNESITMTPPTKAKSVAFASVMRYKLILGLITVKNMQNKIDSAAIVTDLKKISNIDGEFVSAEKTKVDGKDAVKVVLKTSDGYTAVYVVASILKLGTLSFTDTRLEKIDSEDNMKIMYSFKIKDTMLDWIPYIVIFLVICFLIGVIKNKISPPKKSASIFDA